MGLPTVEVLCVKYVGCLDCNTDHKLYISTLVKFLELCMFHYIMFFFVGALPSFVASNGWTASILIVAGHKS